MRKFKRIFAIGLLTGAILAVVLAFTQSANAKRSVESSTSPISAVSSLGTPGEFLTGANAGEPLDIVLNYLNENRAALGLTEADVNNAVVSDQYVSQHSGVTHIYLQQVHNGIPVFNAILNSNVTADGRIINIGNRFVGNMVGGVSGTSPAISQEAAVSAAASHVGLAVTEALEVEDVIGGPAQAVVLSNGGVSQNVIPVNLVYQPFKNGVKLAWDVTIYELSSEHWWSIRVDAVSGVVLSQFDWVVHENQNHDGDFPGADVPVGSPGSSSSSQNLLWNSSVVPESYRVFAYPLEDPDGGADTLELNPFDITSNPWGWHDTNGAAGPEFTITRGNNVHADSDLDANNTPDGNAPDGGAGLVFDYPYALNMDPSAYLTASIVNLFYWNNIMHDITYRYGFDEASGNFQENNYGNGGLGSDYVNADAQDGSGTDNANFGTGPDGQNPRMQMFRTTYPFGQAITVNLPLTLTGIYTANPSNNGGPPMGITADVELVIDGTAPINDACEALTNDLTGNIALIVWNQGACNSSVFVQNAANAGAVAAIIIDNTVLPLTNFGGSAAIPSVAIGMNDGQDLLTALNNHTVNVTMGDHPVPGFGRDTDLDNGVIAHEYGHGVSNRLTGGPATASCLGNQEQMGEGWSDLMTLFIHADPADVGTDAREIGVWSLGAGFQGIRNFPYSTDMTINPQTYVDVGATNVPHGVGEIWAAMVWEVYWNLVDVHGFNADIYDDWTTGGNNLTFQLVMDGMKLQPCSPGFLDGRDAILAADMALTGGANQCEIWAGFAKRGAGFSASQGSSQVLGDEVEGYDLPGTCSYVSATPLTQDVCAGGSVDYIVDVGPLFSSPPVTMSSSGEPAGATTSFSPNPVPAVPGVTTMSVDTTGATPAGDYTITITGTDAITSASFGVNLTVFSGGPSAPTLSAPGDGAVNIEYQPTFSWGAVADATGYSIEIATDAGFSNIIESASVSGTTYDMVGVLDPGATYYWRVAADNLCGATTSSAFSFTTLADTCDPGLFTRTSYLEEFEAGEGGWTHSAVTNPLSDTWTLSNANPGPGSGGFAFHAQDLGVPEDQALVSPPIDLPTGDTNLTLQFNNEQIFEDPAGSGGCWDGGHLEITTDAGGNWTPLDAELMSDPYDGVGDNGPPTGLNMWCGQTNGNQPWLKSVVNLDAYAGETVQFRYRMLSDAAVGAEGWYLDDVRIQSCSQSPTDVSLTDFRAETQDSGWVTLAAVLVVFVAGLGAMLFRRNRLTV